jgi:GntR family transcriptional regulator
MILNLSELSDEPLHAQVSRQIRAKILSQTLAGGDALPSIRGLARQQRISVITVQRAYEDLEREGLVLARRGKGFWVASVPAAKGRQLAEHRLETALGKLVGNAIDEGLDADGIRNILERLIHKGAHQ